MVISDINVLCIGQNKAVKYPWMRNSYITSRKSSDTSGLIYKNKYINAQNTTGIWYQVEPLARLEGKYDCEFFDASTEGNKYRVIFIQDDFKQRIVNFINEMLELSPTHIVCFFIDLQGEENKPNYISIYNFKKVVDENALYFNTEYWIHQ